LESVCRGNSTEGSNPSLSASSQAINTKDLSHSRRSTESGQFSDRRFCGRFGTKSGGCYPPHCTESHWTRQIQHWTVARGSHRAPQIPSLSPALTTTYEATDRVGRFEPALIHWSMVVRSTSRNAQCGTRSLVLRPLRTRVAPSPEKMATDISRLVAVPRARVQTRHHASASPRSSSHYGRHHSTRGSAGGASSSCA
jgi:hypothetical protein